jgi:hypothetical protein
MVIEGMEISFKQRMAYELINMSYYAIVFAVICPKHS